MNTGLVTNAFRYWYDRSPLADLKFVTLGDALSFYDKYPSFKANFDKSLKTLPQPKIKAAMEKLADAYGTSYPPVDEWMNYLAREGATVTAGEVASAAAAGVGEAIGAIGGIATKSLFLYVGIAAIGAFILPQILKSKK